MQVSVHKGRSTTKSLSLSYDVSNDVISSQIRAGRDKDSELLATWTVSYKTDGTDGQLVLYLDDSITGAIEASVGYMDILRVTGGEPVSVLNDPIEVLFKEVVTV